MIRSFMFAICFATFMMVGCADKGCGCCDKCTGVVCSGQNCTPCQCDHPDCVCPGVSK